MSYLRTSGYVLGQAFSKTGGAIPLFWTADILSRIEELAGVGYWEFNAECPGWAICSPGVYRIFGLQMTNASLVDVQVFHALVHSDDVKKYSECMKQAEETLAPYDIEYRVVRGDRDVRFVHERGLPVFNPSGQPVQMLGIIMDITESKITEQILQENEQRYRSLMENNSSISIVEVDVAGNVLQANRPFFKKTGYQPEDVLQKPFLNLVGQEDYERVQSLYLRSLCEEVSETLEISVRSRLGKPQEVACSISPVVVNSIPLGFFAMLQDLTEEREREALLLKTEKLSVIGQLAAGIAHEIRNPLTTLKGFLKLIKEGSAHQRIDHYCEIMEGELDRMESITGELLLLAKPQVVNFRIVNVGDVLHNLVELLSSQAILSNVQIVLRLKDTLRVYGVENQLKQIFINVIKNALESMPDGGCLWISGRRDGTQCILEFKDEGCGISPDRLGRLGEPFYTTKERGTGLGLTTSYRLVHAHDGRMELESQLGRGTTLTLYLPYVEHLTQA